MMGTGTPHSTRLVVAKANSDNAAKGSNRLPLLGHAWENFIFTGSSLVGNKNARFKLVWLHGEDNSVMYNKNTWVDSDHEYAYSQDPGPGTS